MRWGGEVGGCSFESWLIPTHLPTAYTVDLQWLSSVECCFSYTMVPK